MVAPNYQNMLKTLLVTISFVFLSFSGFSQITVQLTTGNYKNDEPTKNPSTHPNEFAGCLYEGYYFLWLQFNRLPTEEQKLMLKGTGVQLFDYLPTNTYYAAFPRAYDFSILRNYNVFAVTKPAMYSKIESSLFNPGSIGWAVAGDSELMVHIVFIHFQTKDHLINSLLAGNISFKLMTGEGGNDIIVKAGMGAIQQIARHPLVQYIEPIPAPAVVEDVQAVGVQRVNAIFTSDNYTAGKKYDGENVRIAIGDQGYVGPHIDFKGRMINNATNIIAANTHGDHTSGIITGAANLNPTVRGQAPGAKLFAYDYYNDYLLYPSIYDIDSRIFI